MLSARELAPNNTAATSWVNQRITFTHGYGVAMVPVNQATPGGQPDLIIRDLPPVSTTGAPAITEPRIYFGEDESGYVVVDAKQPAFDYPKCADPSGVSGQDARAWTGTSGIRLDTTLSRLLFGLRFGDLNLLISDQVTSDSKLLFRRSLNDRLGTIAPFLHYDKDPYLVISNGKLYYIQDAYTISDRATYLAIQAKIQSRILVEKDPVLLNIYHVIRVNPQKWPVVYAPGAQAFADHLPSPPTALPLGPPRVV